MDFLNKAFSQVSDLFKSMTPGARMTAGMLLVMIVVSLGYLFTMQGNRADRYLFGSQEFSDEDIAAMTQAFALEKLDDYQFDGRRVRVPQNRLSQYMQALGTVGFTPADIESDIEEIRERGSGLFESETEKTFWRSQAQQQKLARAIAKRPEIDWATVQYQEVKMGGFPPVTERKATVVACGANGQALERSTANTIRATASSWFGIHPEDVAVNDVHGRTYSGEDVDGLGKEARMYADAKSHYEEYYRGKIQQCLSYIGPGVTAIVNVEMDPTISNETNMVTVDPQATAVKSDSLTKSSQSRPAMGGRPGAVPNEVPGNEAKTLEMGNSQESSTDESREQQLSVTGHQQTRKLAAALVPKVVTAAISIPKSYINHVYDKKSEGLALSTPPPTKLTPEEREAALDEEEKAIIKQIEDKVVKALPPLDAGENPFPQVEVSCYYEPTIEPAQSPSMSASAMAWFSRNWQTLGLFLIGLASLFVLRSMIRGAAAAISSTAQAMPEMVHPEVEEEEEEDLPVVLHRRTRPTGAALQDELTILVREDPDAAANVLRAWIGDAA